MTDAHGLLADEMKSPFASVFHGLLLTGILLVPVLAAGEPTRLTVMSLNIYGWATMPQQATDYADLINRLDIDILGIQEGVEDWKIKGMPTDYSRAQALADALGSCWQHRYQVFVNHCRGVEFISNERFDLSDGPNAVRTGELVNFRKGAVEVVLVNVHWDHESPAARKASAVETAEVITRHQNTPLVVVGDFNSRCGGEEVGQMLRQASLTQVVDGGIDCVFSRGLEGSGRVIDAQPSDHPAVLASFIVPSR